VRKMAYDHIYPVMAAHQKLFVVPGAFACSNLSCECLTLRQHFSVFGILRSGYCTRIVCSEYVFPRRRSALGITPVSQGAPTYLPDVVPDCADMPLAQSSRSVVDKLRAYFVSSLTSCKLSESPTARAGAVAVCTILQTASLKLSQVLQLPYSNIS
jgi:hypothetical protein